ncbi:MAG TPA: 2-dehydropantoate 2-reductase [Gemmatimonadaceae bacterium]|nr:2-dehydropantoate 2-reductase [Gemmatimonadaceae bacterium]
MTTIAIIGPGAIGGILAAWLGQDPDNAVTVCARSAFDHLEVETPTGTITSAPRVITDPSDATPVDWVLITTKAYDAASAASWLPALRRADSRVVVLQNGVEHVERFSPYVPTDSLVPAVIDCPAERTAPGRMRQRGASWIVVPDTVNGRAFVPLWSKTNFDVTTDDFRTRAWAKLCINAPGAISAILLKPTGVIQVEPIAELTRGIVRECLAVGRAEGARLEDSIVEAVVEGARRAPADSLNSLIADRMAGRPMEIDARNGAIVRFGKKHGIPTPLNEMAVALLVAAQDARTY